MFIRSALFNIAFWVWIGIIGGLTLPISCVYRPFALTVAKIWGHGTLWLLKVICNIRYELHGKEHIPNYPCIVASKHQSAWDTAIFWVLLEKPSFVLKQELIYLPIFGWNLLLQRSIYINRKTGASALKKMLREAISIKQEGRQIVIFPEGTRTIPNAEPDYKSGVSALYSSLELPVIPVGLNSGLLWGKNSFLKKSGVIQIEFMPPINAGMKPREFLTKLEQDIENSCNKMSSY